MGSLFSELVTLMTFQLKDRPSCASIVVNNCDIREDIHLVAVLQDFHSYVVHMVRTVRWLDMHRLHSGDHNGCFPHLPTSAILLGHYYRRRPLRKRISFLHPHWFRQYSHRCDGTSFAHPLPSKAGDVADQENDPDRNLRVRSLYMHYRCFTSPRNYHHRFQRLYLLYRQRHDLQRIGAGSRYYPRLCPYSAPLAANPNRAIQQVWGRNWQYFAQVEAPSQLGYIWRLKKTANTVRQ